MRGVLLLLLIVYTTAQTTVVKTEVNFLFKGLVGSVQAAKPNTTVPDSPVTLPGQGSSQGQFSLVTQTYSYESTFLQKQFEGYVAYQQRGTVSTRPAVIIFPDFLNIEESTKELARKLAEQGYIAFVADYYGKKVYSRSTREQIAAALDSSKTLQADFSTYTQTLLAAYNAAASDAKVDRTRVGLLGYGFGGSVVLDAVRTGMTPHTVIAVHPFSLKPTPKVVVSATVYGAGIFSHIGFFDKNTPNTDFVAFASELNGKSVIDWSTYNFRAVGCFSDSEAEALSKNAPNLFDANDCKYDAKSAARSWREVVATFNERLNS